MWLGATSQTQYARKRRPPQRRLALTAVVIWPVIIALGWDRGLMGDDLRLGASLLLYIAISFELRCGWVPFTTIMGIVFGLMSDPIVKAGTYESMVWQTCCHLAAGVVVGLLSGLILDSIPQTRQIPRHHMR